MRKRRLFTPGPTPLLPEAQLAMARPIRHHRTPEFRELLLATRRNLQQIYRTRGDVVILGCSGSGAMEAAVASLLSPERRALAVVAGKFGERWVEICNAHGIPCTPLCKEYGEAASAAEIVGALRREPDTRALLIQGCETSTGTAHDLEAVSAAVRQEFPEVLLIVDGITAVACQSVETDQWGLDAVIGGSQKSFAMSPGLAFVSLSERAVERMRETGVGRYYLDLSREVVKQRQGQTAFTSAVSLIEALHASTEAIVSQGLEQVIRETEIMARCTRSALHALGFRLLSQAPANAVTAAYPPAGVEAPALLSLLESEFGLKPAGGQGPLKGKILRFAHLGYFDLLDVFSLVAALELALQRLGVEVRPAAGLEAARLEEQSQGAAAAGPAR